MNSTQRAPKAVSRVAAPAPCVPLEPCPEIVGSRELRQTPLLCGIDREELQRSFLAAPHFKGVPLASLLDSQEPLRLILLCEGTYYARQAAVYLSSLRRSEGADEEDDEDWDSLYFEPDCCPPARSETLTVAGPWVLDPGLQSQGARGPKGLSLGLEDSAEEILSEGVHQLLLTAEQGPVLTDAVVRALADQKSADLFVALRPDQQSAPFIDRLRFEQGFLVSTVQDADEGYLSDVFFAAAKAQKISLAKTVQFQTVLRDLRSMRGVRFSEYDFSALLSYAAKAHGKTPPLTTQQLLWHPFQSGRRSGAEALSALVGLDGVKQTLRRVLALAQLEKRQVLAGRTVTPTCRNLAFSGKPGTCKSVTARIMAEILRECGVGSGVFVEAGREQLIGEYLGQTSPKIAALFAQARGGVLFIDEAGALLNTQQDSYADEAVNALVRHMELCPETMVIFATYPEETQSLLRSNPGLASRISRVIHFDAYSDEELYEILRYLAGKSDCRIDPAAQTVCTDFFHALKGQSGESFGNGREARRLLVAAQEQLALRAMEDPSVPLDLLSCGDFTAAAASLCADSVQKKRILGF